MVQGVLGVEGSLFHLEGVWVGGVQINGQAHKVIEDPSLR